MLVSKVCVFSSWRDVVQH